MTELIKDLILKLNDRISGSLSHWENPEQMAAECAAVLQSSATEIADLNKRLLAYRAYIADFTNDMERAMRRPKP